MHVTPEQRTILRDLASRVRDLAALPAQQEKRDAITAANGLRSTRPLVYCFPEGAWGECIPHESLRCEDPILRGWEQRLRMAIYTHEVFGDDQPIDAVLNVYYHAGFGDWGIENRTEMRDAGARHVYYLNPYTSLSLASHSNLEAYHCEAPLQDRADLDKLRVPQLHVDRETSDQWLRVAQDLVGDLLEVRRRGGMWTQVGGYPVTAVNLRGMENLWIDLYDDPEWVRALLDFLARAHHEQLDALEREGLLTLNNGAEWIGTGGIGYTDALPAEGFDPNRVRLCDVWGGSQAQDLVGISPDMFAEFFFPHMRTIMERYGLSHYGCCEPVHDWLGSLKQVRNLRRVSVSPWADVRKSAERLGGDYVFCYKPLPTPVTTEHFDPAALRGAYAEVFRITREHGCHVEIMMKDLHSIRRQPQRLTQWVQAAREAVAEAYA